MPYHVMIAQFPGFNQVHPDASGWVTKTALEMAKDPRIGSITPWRLSDTPITMVRNRCVKDALSLNVDYLLMIDADMSPDYAWPAAPAFWDKAWEFMLARDPGLPPATIAAPYCGAPPNEVVCVLEWQHKQDQHGNEGVRLGLVDRTDAARRTGIEEVAGLATGLILYDTRVFRALPPPWFEYEWTDEYQTDKASTEDVYQTRNASLAGLPQYVAWDCWAGHNKLKKVVGPKKILPSQVKPPARESTIFVSRDPDLV
jgi:hypothetical protein